MIGNLFLLLLLIALTYALPNGHKVLPIFQKITRSVRGVNALASTMPKYKPILVSAQNTQAHSTFAVTTHKDFQKTNQGLALNKSQHLHNLEPKRNLMTSSDNKYIEVVDKRIYHVGMMVSDTEVVHATPFGVKKELLIDAVARNGACKLELACVNLDPCWKEKAVRWAENEVGAEYNDIYSTDFKDSKNERAFYCCQLVQEAYKQTKPKDVMDPFPEHKLNFNDADGNMIPYWENYFKYRSLPVPQGEPGSHPSVQHSASFIKPIATKTFHKID
uniref:Uncharacterized protein n=1 Tax=Ditylenchus dipsaci TaxID=166011 RepID=A0A915ECT0_9BILA